jgi:epoxyqueuosine reductase
MIPRQPGPCGAQIEGRRKSMKGKTVTLTRQLEEFCVDHGADLFGAGDLAPAREAIVAQGGPLVEPFPRAVSLGMRLSDDIVDAHDPNQKHRESLYWHHIYDVVSTSLNFLAYDVGRWLNAKGFRALPVPASLPYNLAKLEGVFSHKLGAHLAGLGWIGKSCLLLTREFGPRVRFVTVLTDAPLDTGSPVDHPCGECRVCVEACPVKAFTGVEFRPEEPLRARFDAPKCSEYRRDHACGVCVSTCPTGKPKRRAARGRAA